MAKVLNTFINGKMDSDTSYSLLDNKSFVRAENLRIHGHGQDGSFESLKGSKMVSDHSEDSTMRMVRMYEGSNNKIYYFLAGAGGNSKIVEYDTETEVSKVIAFDTKNILRFNDVKFLLSVNQIDNYLIFSSDKWKYPRVIDINRETPEILDEQDILLPVKPPMDPPYIVGYDYDKQKDTGKQDTFVSFAYRYKYKKGDYSTLSFFSDAAFVEGGRDKDDNIQQFKVNRERENIAMKNAYNVITLNVNTGGPEITDIEVIAVEHGSNTGYIIQNVNKEKSGVADFNRNYSIEYNFSQNYKVIPEDDLLAMYSNVPMYPKTQEVIGNRLVFANYKDGFQLDNFNSVDFEVFHQPETWSEEGDRRNKTVVSLFTYSVGIVYYDLYNKSTSVLINNNSKDNEVFIPYEYRTGINKIKAKILNDPPTNADRFKFVVQSEKLNYENVYSSIVRKIGDDLYIYLSTENANKLKVGDRFFMVQESALTHEIFTVNEIKTINKSEINLGLSGLYAISEGWRDIDVKTNQGDEGTITQLERTSILSGSTEKTTFSGINGKLNFSNSPITIGAIKENDHISLLIEFKFKRNRTSDAPITTGTPDDRMNGHLFDVIRFNEEFFSTRDYNNIQSSIADNLTNAYFSATADSTSVTIKTTGIFQEYVRSHAPNAFYAENVKGFRIAAEVSISATVTRGSAGLFFRTVNKENLNTFYFETPTLYKIENGKHIGADADGSFDTGFYNGYTWGNGIESYKIMDSFNGKPLWFNFRANLVDSNKDKQSTRSNSISHSELYNAEMNINQLSMFNLVKANYIDLPIENGPIQIIKTEGANLTAFCTNKIYEVMYGQSILMDLTGNENVAVSKEVFGGIRALPYEFGVSENPESVVLDSNRIFFTDKYRSRILVKVGHEIGELNGVRSGFHEQGADLLKNHSSFLGSYDDKYGEYVLGFDEDFSVRYSFDLKGFTFFNTQKFEYTLGANGNHYTAYEGKLYKNEVTQEYNNLSGQQDQTSKVVYVVNPEVNSDKIFKAHYLQSNKPWDTSVRTNLTASSFTEGVYEKRESFYYTDIFRDSSGNLGIVGVGSIQDIDGNTITYSGPISNQVSVGETLTNQSMTSFSEIISISGNTIKVSNANIFTVGEFTASQKKQVGSFRPSGVPIRGEWMEVTLSTKGVEATYINSISTEIIKSMP